MLDVLSVKKIRRQLSQGLNALVYGADRDAVGQLEHSEAIAPLDMKRFRNCLTE